MAFLDKLKDMKDNAVSAASEASQKAKEAYETNKQQQAEKKAQEEALKAELTAKAHKLADDIILAIDENYKEDLDGFFNGKDKSDVFRYAKNFFEKILLPANSKDKTYISMYPHINSKLSEKSMSVFNEHVSYEDILVHMKDKEGQEFLLTYNKFYFRIALPENKKYFAVGSIMTEKVSAFSLKKDNNCYVFLCDDVEIARIQINSGKESDYITLNRFFNDIKNGDFDITDEEIDSVIKEKIGSVTYIELQNELDDDEKILFFTWNSSNGYVACTTSKIVVADKQSGGNISNVSRYYYDEINSIETNQQATDLGTSSSSSLGGFLLETAVTAVAESAIDSFLKDVCDLKIVANGSFKTMPGMVKIEADRIVSIYNAFKKEIRKNEREEKKTAANPQVIIQQTGQPDILDQIQKLATLKDAGILSEEEFNTKKQELLSKM